MNTPTPAPTALTDTDFDAIDQILDDLRERLDEVPQWEFCEGFMAALVCCRREIPASEYLGALLGDDAGGAFGPGLFNSPEQYEQFLTLWQRRWDEVRTALDAPVDSLEDERAYAPEVLDVRGAIAAMTDEERAAMAEELANEELPSFAQVWALGFMYVVETWPEEWTAPRDKEAAGWLEDALDRIVAMTEDDDGEPSVSMFGEDSPPSVSQERLNAYGEAIWAVYDLRDLWKSIGPRVEQVVKGEEPGRNDPCSCGSGKKYKKCCGA
ncbi:YecA/YgfB family protein [Macromonas nakdongensis]|uniref:YecA/YgfB family protein n=1 Tax=Macromonas nakdongensis TaxID=1843082 RepID=UPI000C34F2E0|nr:YecA family protein [Macromonas nakdongensis]